MGDFKLPYQALFDAFVQSIKMDATSAKVYERLRTSCTNACVQLAAVQIDKS